MRGQALNLQMEQGKCERHRPATATETRTPRCASSNFCMLRLVCIMLKPIRSRYAREQHSFVGWWGREAESSAVFDEGSQVEGGFRRRWVVIRRVSGAPVQNACTGEMRGGACRKDSIFDQPACCAGLAFSGYLRQCASIRSGTSHQTRLASLNPVPLVSFQQYPRYLFDVN